MTKDVASAIQAFNVARKQNPKLTKAKFLRDYCDQNDASVTSLARAMSDHKALHRRREKRTQTRTIGEATASSSDMKAEDEG